MLPQQSIVQQKHWIYKHAIGDFEVTEVRLNSVTMQAVKLLRKKPHTVNKIGDFLSTDIFKLRLNLRCVFFKYIFQNCIAQLGKV